MRGVIENISRGTAEMCWNIIEHVQYSLRFKSQIKCFRTHVAMDKLFCFDTWNS
jgi:hypothetical protein